MKLTWYPAVSLDGYIADSAGRSDFVSEHDELEFGRLVNASGAVIVGNRTFRQYHQPSNPFPQAHTYVITRNANQLSPDPAITFIAQGPMEVMRRLHADGFTRAVLSGGGETSGLFASQGLIDEAWISTYPLMLGVGTRLLGQYQGSLRLEWQEGFMYPGGIVHNRYRVN